MAKRFKTVADYKGYEVVTFEDGVEHVVYDNEVLTGESHLDNWLLGSVTQYAIETGRDPIAAYNKAIENGHETHWANAMGSMLTSTPTKGPKRIVVNYGDKIIFHGQEFIIEKAHNRNIKLRKAV